MSGIAVPAAAGRLGQVTFRGIVRSEWVKLRTLRSTFLTLAGAMAAMVGFGLLVTSMTAHRWSGMDEAQRAATNPLAQSQIGFFIAQLAVGVLGVLVVSGEYSTGMIRATLSAVPDRLPVLWAKSAVFAVVTWLLMTAAALAAFLGGQAVLRSTGVGLSLGDPGVARAVLGNGLYLTVVGLFGVGLAGVLRNAAGAIACVFGVLLVLPELVKAFPKSLSEAVWPYLPSTAGRAVATVDAGPMALSPWAGFAVFCLYAGAALAAAAVVLKRRDA
ncbi:ABC transporter permease subunit [Yinghuangia soli]|uniref:ABC transporter permease subunit n=1 Tax=Yinghuangia soli TaxID=2908204 RepID=A0AA41TZV0_9ACTN|nr:ABC transporter permease subunit [Yinghuangia soli]MCF2529183.1 ABC transporter permease subunit [Yinghuangia soli]